MQNYEGASQMRTSVRAYVGSTLEFIYIALTMGTYTYGRAAVCAYRVRK